MECGVVVVSASALVVQVAWLVATATLVQRSVAPFLNVTVPMFPTAGVMVEVKVTDCPTFDGFCDDESVVEVFTVEAVTATVPVESVLPWPPVQPVACAHTLTVHVPATLGV
jgi:hypothetical protein